MTPLEATNVFLVSVTASNPAAFTVCTPNNHADLGYYLVIAGPHAVLNVSTYVPPRHGG